MTTDELIETLERLAGDAAAGERNPGAQAFGPSRYVEIRRDTLPHILSALKENKRLREALECIERNSILSKQPATERWLRDNLHACLLAARAALQPQGEK